MSPMGQMHLFSRLEQITPSWGTGDLTSDWARAARLGTQRVLQADPEMLVTGIAEMGDGEWRWVR